MGLFAQFFSWLLKRLLGAALVAGLGLAALAWWQQQKAGVDFATARQTELLTLGREAAKLQADLAEVQQRITAGQSVVTAEELRSRQAAKVARELDELNSGLSRLTTDGAQVKENDERLARLKQMEADADKRAADTRQALTRDQWAQDGVELALARAREKYEATRKDDSAPLHYLRLAWDRYGQLVLVAAGVIFIAPSVWWFLRSSRPPE
ncbi:MAG: hypothetical protein HY302_01745 [Opitutae bacterium]|nr:hypothetical protein [Opitutae bacterium]